MPERAAAVCRELTKRFEQIERGSLVELAERFRESPRGEITLVVGPSARTEALDVSAEAVESVAELVAAGLSRRHAVHLVARVTGVARNTLYRASL
jgi:16S rRNA (cytidine1402-2'-O)-methyltransferase